MESWGHLVEMCKWKRSAEDKNRDFSQLSDLERQWMSCGSLMHYDLGSHWRLSWETARSTVLVFYGQKNIIQHTSSVNRYIVMGNKALIFQRETWMYDEQRADISSHTEYASVNHLVGLNSYIYIKGFGLKATKHSWSEKKYRLISQLHAGQQRRFTPSRNYKAI